MITDNYSKLPGQNDPSYCGSGKKYQMKEP